MTVITQSSSGRYIPKYTYTGSPNNEYLVAQSKRVAGAVLPRMSGYSEYQVHVASAIQHGWTLDIAASEQMRAKPYIEDAAVMFHRSEPQLHNIKPLPAQHGRATLDMATRAVAENSHLESGQTLLVSTTAQYVPKSTIQAARTLHKLGKGDIFVQALGMPGNAPTKAYVLELAVLSRLVAGA